MATTPYQPPVPGGFNSLGGQPWTAGSNTAYGQSGGNNALSQNLFGQGQQQLQGLVPGLYSNLLGGGFGSYTQPATQAYNQQFFTQPGGIASTLAAQYGAGSPQIGSQYTQGLTNLLGNMMPQYTSAIGQAGAYGLTPVGTSGQGTYTGASNQSTGYGSTLLGMLAQLAQIPFNIF
jgi:hypothetical protein